MTGTLLRVEALRKRFQGIVALDAVDLAVRAGERLGVIGPNGSGKTTMMNCIAGLYRPTGGRIIYQDADVTGWPAHARARRGIARTFQLPRPFASLSLQENLSVPLESIAGLSDPRQVVDRARATLELFGLGGQAGSPAGTLTQIGLRKLELARAVVAGPRLLIADETMAGLSATEVDEILRVLLELSGRGITIILIEHVMRAILAFSERVVCLDAGVKIADGRPDAVMRDPHVERAYLGE